MVNFRVTPVTQAREKIKELFKKRPLEFRFKVKHNKFNNLTHVTRWINGYIRNVPFSTIHAALYQGYQGNHFGEEITNCLKIVANRAKTGPTVGPKSEMSKNVKKVLESNSKEIESQNFKRVADLARYVYNIMEKNKMTIDQQTLERKFSYWHVGANIHYHYTNENYSGKVMSLIRRIKTGE